jgi:hypothetical protein
LLPKDFGIGPELDNQNISKLIQRSSKLNQLTKYSIATMAPITSPHFTSVGNDDQSSTFMVLALDFNGEMTIVDCTLAIKSAIQNKERTMEMNVIRESENLQSNLSCLDSIIDVCWWDSSSALFYSTVTASGRIDLWKYADSHVTKTGNLISSMQVSTNVSFIADVSTLELLPLATFQLGYNQTSHVPHLCGINMLNANDIIQSLI